MSDLYELNSLLMIFLCLLAIITSSLVLLGRNSAISPAQKFVEKRFAIFLLLSERYTFTKVIHQQIFNLLIIEINICYNFIEHISKKWYNIASQSSSDSKKRLLWSCTSFLWSSDFSCLLLLSSHFYWSKYWYYKCFE